MVKRGIEAYQFTRLSKETIIKPFKCADSDLNGFLMEDAKNYSEDLMAVTYLIEDVEKEKTVAYFSLLNDKITYDPELSSVWNRLNRRVSNAKRKRDYPAVKIGRLAIAEEYSGQGLGKDIIRLIKHIFTHSNRTGCRFITVDAYKEATPFYEKCGFLFFSQKDNREKTRAMFYDLKRFTDS